MCTHTPGAHTQGTIVGIQEALELGDLSVCVCLSACHCLTVSANLKGAPESLAALLEGESLFNDASGECVSE